MNDISDIGLLKRQVRDVQSVAANIQHFVRKLVEPPTVLVDPLIGALTCAFVAKMRRQPPDAVLLQRYNNNARIGAVLRAATQPAMTNVSGWAAELAASSVGPMLLGAPVPSAFATLSERSVRVDLTAVGQVTLPTRSAAPKINAAFIAEGQPIPVRRLGLASAPLVPKRMGVISDFSLELASHSTPSIESVIRQAMSQDTGIALDSVLLDANAADAIRPAGLLFGATAVPPSNAQPAIEAMRADITNAIAAITPAGGAPDPVLVVHPARRVSMMMSTVGPFIPVIGTAAVPLTMLVAIDASGLATGLSLGARFEVSEAATIHEEDTPLPISATGTPATSRGSRALAVANREHRHPTVIRRLMGHSRQRRRRRC